ncbi:MAG: amidohydrolase family protein [Planctomycetota bacterium]
MRTLASLRSFFSSSRSSTRTWLFPLALASLTDSAAAQEVTAVKAGRVLTMAGGELTGVTLLIENGRIAKMGTEVEVPWNAKTIDASDKVVMPTYVLAHSSGGMRGANENLANVPYLRVQDAVDPSSKFFQECLRNGIGTVHVIPGNRTLIGGQGMLVKPVGQTVEDMTVPGKGGLKLSLFAEPGGALAQATKLRRALDEVRDHVADFERRKAEFAAEKAAGGAADKKEFDGKIDPTKQPSVDLLQKTSIAFLYVPDAAMLAEAQRLQREFGFRAVLVLGPAVHRGVAHLRDLEFPVVLDGDLEVWEKDPVTEKRTKACLARELYKRGIPFALDVATGLNGAERFPWWQMATLIRNGVDRDTALRAFTTVPAKLLGIDGEVGSLAEGKRANLQILTGDPLSSMTWVDTVLLDGETVYERDKDPRLQYLFGKSTETDK